MIVETLLASSTDEGNVALAVAVLGRVVKTGDVVVVVVVVVVAVVVVERDLVQAVVLKIHVEIIFCTIADSF